MVATLLMTLAFTAPVPKDGPVALPTTAPPRLEFVTFDGAAATVIQAVRVTVEVEREIVVVIVPKGLPEVATQKVLVAEPGIDWLPVPVEWDLKQVAFATVGGTRLTAKEAGEKLTGGGVCVTATTGLPIDPSYLKVLRHETIIITRPTDEWSHGLPPFAKHSLKEYPMIATLLLSLALVNPVPKDGPVAPPKGPAPTLQYFKADGDSLVRNMQVTQMVPVRKKVEVTRVVNGQEVTEIVEVTEYQVQTVTESVKIATKDATFGTAAGKKLTADEALGRLKDGAICVVAYKPHGAEAAYLKAFKDETLVITLPQPVPVPQPVPAPKR